MLESFLTGQETILLLCGEIRRDKSFSQAQPKLRILFEILARYFQRQNDQLISSLEKQYQSDPKTLKMLEFWQVDLKDVKLQIFAFFERYPTEGMVPKARRFAVEFADLCALLETRFEIERTYLFPILQRG